MADCTLSPPAPPTRQPRQPCCPGSKMPARSRRPAAACGDSWPHAPLPPGLPQSTQENSTPLPPVNYAPRDLLHIHPHLFQVLSSYPLGRIKKLPFMSFRITVITADESPASRRGFHFKLTQSLTPLAPTASPPNRHQLPLVAIKPSILKVNEDKWYILILLLSPITTIPTTWFSTTPRCRYRIF